MLKPFNPDCKEEVTEENCERLTGYGFKKLLGLTGIYGFLGCSNIDLLPEKTIKGKYPLIELEIISRPITLKRIVDMQNRTIQNTLIRLSTARCGDGLKILCSQVRKASVAGLTEIRCTAFKKKGELYGYIVFGILGFTMRETEITNYITFLDKEGIERMSLVDLLSGDLRTVWEKKGHSWKGKFSLARKSKNKRLLFKYVKAKAQNIIDEVLALSKPIPTSHGMKDVLQQKDSSFVQQKAYEIKKLKKLSKLIH